MSDSNLSHIIKRIGESKKINITMADLGASGESWDSYENIKEIADLIRFDPDAREMIKVDGINGHKVIMVNKAVVESDAEFVDFHLTKSPYCSSTLLPDFDKLKNYPYVNDFIVEKKVKVPSITIDNALVVSGITNINWIKIDTQGTEFRILKSIRQETFSKVMVCDIEASLYRHYVNADILPVIHDFMLEKGFWVVHTRPHLNNRMTLRTAQKMESKYSGRARKIYNFSKHDSVTTLEFCYARTIESAIENNYSEDDFIKLFICHFSLGAYEYCIDIIDAMEFQFGKTAILSILSEATFNSIDRKIEMARFPYLVESIIFRLKRLFPNHLWK